MNDELPPIGYAARAATIRERLAATEVGALALTDPVSVRWATGFGGSNGSVAVLPDRLVLVTDGRYRDRAEAELAAAGVDCEVLIGATQSQQHEQFVSAGMKARRLRDDLLAERFG